MLEPGEGGNRSGRLAEHQPWSFALLPPCPAVRFKRQLVGLALGEPPALLFLHHTESVSAGEATEATGRELSRRLQVRPRLVLFGPIPVLSQSGFAQEGAVCPMRCRTFVENRDQGAASFRIRTVNRRSIVVVAQKPRSSAFTRTALPSR